MLSGGKIYDKMHGSAEILFNICRTRADIFSVCGMQAQSYIDAAVSLCVGC